MGVTHTPPSVPHPMYHQAHQCRQSAQTASKEVYLIKRPKAQGTLSSYAPWLCLVHDGFLASSPCDKMLSHCFSAQSFLLFMLLQEFSQLSTTIQIPEVPTSSPPPQEQVYQEFSLALLLLYSLTF